MKIRNLISAACQYFIFSCSIFFLSAMGALAQPVLVPSDLINPFIPGERGLRFSLPVGTANANNIEAWVFYSKNKNDLENLNSGSFQPGKHYGRSVMIKAGNTVQCTFVFPHPFHPATPNADMFASLAGTSGLVTVGFPTPEIIWGIPMPGSSTGIKIDFNPLLVSKGECVFYRIYKRVKSGGNYTDQLSEIKKFTMPDSFNIGIAGDSFGAGEGAPDDEFELTGNNNDMWIDCKCHRSKKSGLLKGVKKFIANFPDKAVDYSFQACTGAVTDVFFRVKQVTNTHPPGTALYTDDCGGGENEIQFQRIRNDLITTRKHDQVHMLLMSGGGNNTGFGDLVIQYLIAPLNLAALNNAGNLLHIDVLGEFKDKLDELPDDYADVDQGINTFFTEKRPIIGISTYPDPTKGPNGRCGATSVLGPDYPCARYETNYINSPRDEYELIHDEFVIPLNKKVRGTEKLGWHIIEVETESGSHGLCNCDDPYFNTIDASYDEQGDIYGIVHPNRDGYREMYKDKTYSFVVNKYHEFETAYALGVLLGIVQLPQSCPTPETKIIYLGASVNKLRNLFPVLSGLKGFEGLPTDLDIPAFQGKETDSKETDAAFSKIQSNVQYKSAYNSLPVKSTIVKEVRTTRPLGPVYQAGPLLLKSRADLNAFLVSKDFREKMDEMKKRAATAKKAEKKDPLEDMFNN